MDVSKSRRPKNSSEGTFHDWCEASGVIATKRGWPDFVCVQPNGEVFFVEVKKKGSHELRRNQSFVMNYLASKGIQCYRWSPDCGLTKVE